MSGLFDSAWLKWGWAIQEAQTLDGEIKAFAADPKTQRLTTTALEYHPKRHCFILTVTSLPPWPLRLSLRLGNVVHNYRSCLDHIAWALVQRGKTPPAVLNERQRKAIYFPIIDEPDAFNAILVPRGRREAMLPGVLRTDVAKVRRYQPYIHGKRNLPHHVLAVLHALSNEDKHRTIKPFLCLSSETGFYKVIYTSDCDLTRITTRRGGRSLQVNSELARFYIRKTSRSNPDLGLKVHTTVEPAVNEVMRLEDWLTQTEIGILSLLYDLAKPPPEIATLGIVIPPVA